MKSSSDVKTNYNSNLCNINYIENNIVKKKYTSSNFAKPTNHNNQNQITTSYHQNFAIVKQVIETLYGFYVDAGYFEPTYIEGDL